MRILYLSVLVEDSREEMQRVAPFARGPNLDLEWWMESRLLEPELVTFAHAPTAFGRGTDPRRLLADVAGIITGGSVYSANDGRPWQRWATEVLQEGIRKRIPILGICGGHQLLANASEDGSVLPRASYLLRYEDVSITVRGRADPLLEGLPATFVAAFSHGEFAEVQRCLATTADGTCAIARFGNQPTWGLQFHPELTLSRMHQIAQARGQHLDAPQEDIDDRCAHRVVQNFLRIARQGEPQDG